MAKNKFNIFGTRKETAGQSLIKALLGLDTTPEIGILDADYHKVIEIFKMAFDKIMLEVFLRGYGIPGTMPKQPQNKIAEELELKPSDVCKIAHKGMDILRESPYKKMLKDLVPSVSELSEMKQQIIDGNSEKEKSELELRLANSEKEIEALRKEIERLRAIEEAYDTVKADRDSVREERDDYEEKFHSEVKLWEKTQDQIATLTEENRTLTKEVSRLKKSENLWNKSKDQTDMLMTKNYVMSKENSELKKLKKKTKTLLQTMHKSIGDVLEDFYDEDNTETTNIEDLGLSPKVLERLKKAGFKTVKELCRLDDRALTRLKLGDCIPEIKKALREKGLIG